MPPVDPEADVASPCVNVCRINPDTEWCEGCLRTIDEVAEWATMPNAKRRAVLQAIEQRMQSLFEQPAEVEHRDASTRSDTQNGR